MKITIKKNRNYPEVHGVPYPNLTIKNLLIPFEQVLNADFVKYKNHACRVLLNCMHLDKNDDNMEKYAIAAVFHDIGIWTAATFDYINASIAALKTYLKASGKQVWEEELSLMIYWHHKFSTYCGAYQSSVETFRRADLIDVSYGLFIFNGDRRLIRRNLAFYPDAGFHLFLLKSAAHNLLSHPLKPLPMYRW